MHLFKIFEIIYLVIGLIERKSTVCLPVRRVNPRALARGLSTVQADELYFMHLFKLFEMIYLVLGLGER